MSYILTSIMLHSILLIGFISWNLSSALVTNEELPLSSYLVISNRSIAATSTQQLQPKNRIRQASQKLKRVKLNKTHGKNDRRQNIQPLLTAIHTAIAAKQRYPDSAQVMQQTGMVTIGFYADPLGQLSEIKLLISSGLSQLDDAATKAVAAASPITEISNYLREKKFFTIEVIFD